MYKFLTVAAAIIVSVSAFGQGNPCPQGKCPSSVVDRMKEVGFIGSWEGLDNSVVREITTYNTDGTYIYRWAPKSEVSADRDCRFIETGRIVRFDKQKDGSINVTYQMLRINRFQVDGQSEYCGTGTKDLKGEWRGGTYRIDESRKQMEILTPNGQVITTLTRVDSHNLQFDDNPRSNDEGSQSGVESNP